MIYRIGLVLGVMSCSYTCGALAEVWAGESWVLPAALGGLVVGALVAGVVWSHRASVTDR